MAPALAALGDALREYFSDFRSYLFSSWNYPHLWRFAAHQFVPDVVIPLFVCVVLARCSFEVVTRVCFPPTARQLHYRAIEALVKRGDAKECRRLLRRALKLDPQYTPARHSLSALHLYRLQQPDVALRILDEEGEESTRDKGTTRGGRRGDDAREQLVADARAVLQSDHAMVQSLLGEDRHLSLRAAATAASAAGV